MIWSHETSVVKAASEDDDESGRLLRCIPITAFDAYGGNSRSLYFRVVFRTIKKVLAMSSDTSLQVMKRRRMLGLTI